MSEGLNKVLLIGNLGADPELKFTPNGGAVLRIRLATTETYVDKNKERQERTEWHTVSVWGNRAEALNKILSKGRSIYVEGRIQTRTWEDSDGTKRYATDIVATNIVLLSGGTRETQGERTKAENTRRAEPNQNTRREPEQGGFDDFEPNYEDGDIPF